MKLRYLLLLLLPLLGACANKAGNAAQVAVDPSAIVLPFQGNVFVTAPEAGLYDLAPTVIDQSEGTLLRWNDPSVGLSLFFCTSKAGIFHLDVAVALPQGTKESELSFSVGGQSFPLSVKAAGTYSVGDFRVEKPGYVRVDIGGVSAQPSGAQFARPGRFYLSGEAVKGASLCYTPADKVEDSYWYRRGPSVHLFYDFPEGDVEWFYNEATVPEGADIPATYYMLTGFSEGYMGIQTHVKGANSVLFSVWSPYETDNPGSIPADERVQTLRKGAGVTAQDFGGEGSGGQSFMDFPWKAGETLGTLVRVHPGGDGTTDYTGYFRDAEGKWHLLASFRRPKTHTWYKGAYSFLECFDPSTSVYTRQVRFSNGWVRLKDGSWQEVTQARFSCDNTGRTGMRGDLYGVADGDGFVLRNCGFFDESTQYGSRFSRPAGGRQPEIDFESLEKL